MATVWMTYAWADNQDGDVDYLAQELQRAGLTIKLDRWNIGAGRRLWDQIEAFILSPAECDAWLMVATVNSLQSEPCREEFAYALQRALSSRSSSFPVIGLFTGPVDNSLIPAGIRTRLFVSVTDVDWKERIVAAAEGRAPRLDSALVQPFNLRVHENVGPKRYAIELRPRAGVWAPFFAAVPLSEKVRVDPSIMIGPRDVPTASGMLVNVGSGASDDGQWWAMTAGNQANPTTSYYVWCKELPSRLTFGVNGGSPQHIVALGAR